MTGFDDRKRLLRRDARAARRAATGDATARAAADRAAQAAALADAAEPLWAGGRAACITAYRSLETEPPTGLLIERALDAGVRVLLPELLADRDLDWREVRRDGTAGPLLGRHAVEAASVLVVPALLVDRSGRRLGQGGGSYDRALPRRSTDALIVALVNDDELVESLPDEAHDVRVDAVITPGRGLLRLR